MKRLCVAQVCQNKCVLHQVNHVSAGQTDGDQTTSERETPERRAEAALMEGGSSSPLMRARPRCQEAAPDTHSCSYWLLCLFVCLSGCAASRSCLRRHQFNPTSTQQPPLRLARRSRSSSAPSRRRGHFSGLCRHWLAAGGGRGGGVSKH